MTPARFVEQARVEQARRRLEESSAGIEEIARGCGFGTPETMRRAFLRALCGRARRVPPAASDATRPPRPWRSSMSITTGILLFDDAEELDLAGPLEVFTMARQEGDAVVTIAEHDGPVRCAKGLRVLPDHTFADAPAARRARGPRRARAPAARSTTRCCSTGSRRSRPAAPGSRASAPARSCSTPPARRGQAGHDPLGGRSSELRGRAPTSTVLERRPLRRRTATS